MSPSIDLDDDVFDYLKTKAEPFIDTPSTVLRRLLGIGGGTANNPPSVSRTNATAVESVRSGPNSRAAKGGMKTANKNAAPKRTRAASGTLLREDRYERPLLQALADAGGQAPYRDVVDAVGRAMKDDLMPADFETLSSGSVRWQSRLQFVRLRLIERGYLDKNAPRGIWGITDAGRAVIMGGENQ